MICELERARGGPVRLMASCLVVSILTGVISAAGTSTKQSTAATVPDAATLLKFVEARLATEEGFVPGDLITQGMVTRIAKALRDKGWELTNEAELVERTLPDNDFLIKQFSDKKGRAFLDKIRGYPGGIDRVDRWARMPQGEASVGDLIHKIPNGYEWIEAMTTTKRGKRLGERLSKSPSGRDFNKKTGKLYFAESLAKAMDGNLVPMK